MRGSSTFHAQNAGRAGGGEYESHEQLERSGLAGAIRSQKAENLPFLNFEMEGAQSVLRPLAPEADAVGFLETKNFDGSHGKNSETCSENYKQDARIWNG